MRGVDREYEVLIQSIPDIIYEVDSEGNFTFVNNAVKQLGYRPEELIGKHMKTVIHPDDFGNVARSVVLPKYQGKVTGDEGAPKLFDERRTRERMTKNLEVRLLVNGNDNNGDNKSLNHYRGELRTAGANEEHLTLKVLYAEVHSTGRWDKPVEEKDKRFLGSVGIIRNITSCKKAESEERELAAAAAAAAANKKKVQELEVVNKELHETKEVLEKKMHDLEAFHKMAVGRELKMKELKERIAQLESKLKQED